MDEKGNVVDVMKVEGEDDPTWVLWKNAAVYAVVQHFGGNRLWFGGSVGAGAEPVDRHLAARALFYATP